MAVVAASATDLANDALGKLGVPEITDIEDASDAKSQQCYRIYRRARDSELRRHEWSCATERRSLARDTTTPLGDEYQYRYALPQSPYCIKARRVIGFENAVPNINGRPIYKVEGRWLLTDLNEVYLEYTKRIEPSEMDMLLYDAIAAMMASELAMPLGKGKGQRDAMREEYAQTIYDAGFVDDDEKTGPVRNYNEDWADAGRV